MTFQALLFGLILVPVALIVLLRANAAIAFMGLCLGSVLATYTTSDVSSVVTITSPSSSVLATNQTVQLGLLIVPLILVLLFTRGSVKGRKRFSNLFPALATGLLSALLIVPLLSVRMQRNIHAQHVWAYVSNAQTAILLGGATFSLLFILVTHRSKKGDGDEGKKHGKHS